jgi:hypothetical protein
MEKVAETALSSVVKLVYFRLHASAEQQGVPKRQERGIGKSLYACDFKGDYQFSPVVVRQVAAAFSTEW